MLSNPNFIAISSRNIARDFLLIFATRMEEVSVIATILIGKDLESEIFSFLIIPEECRFFFVNIFNVALDTLYDFTTFLLHSK